MTTLEISLNNTIINSLQSVKYLGSARKTNNIANNVKTILKNYAEALEDISPVFVNVEDAIKFAKKEISNYRKSEK
jgi:hypothetical protein